MPKIPQYVAQQGIKTGPVADQINVGAMTAPAAAIGSYANAAQDAGAFFESREKERGLRWAGDAQYKFTNAMTEWHMANQDREDYGPAFKEYAEKVSSDFISAAPNKQAGLALQQQLQRSISQQYEVALRAGEKTRLENFDLAEFNSTQSYMELYRQMQAKDPIGASAIVEGHAVGQIARINAAMADKAPAFALKMRARAIETVIEGVMDTDPDLAEMLLMESKDIPEQLRQAKLDKINNTRKQLRVLGANEFHRSIENGFANAEESGAPYVAPSLNDFKAFYPDENSATIAHQNFQEKVDIHNTAVGFVKEVSGMNEHSMRKVLEESKTKIGGVVGKEARERAGNMVKALGEFANDHPVSFVHAYNPIVSRARELYEGATEKDKPRLFQQLNAEAMRYQGHAPLGAPDAGYYLGLDSHQISVMTKEQAKKLAGDINSGTPDEKVRAIRAFNDMYADDPAARTIAFRDMARLPDGEAITQQVQTLAMHADAPYARQLAESMVRGKALENAKNKGLKLEDYDKEVSGDKWSAFVRMYGGDNTQNSHVVAGFRNAIVSFAASLDVGSARDAVKKSIDILIGSKFHFEQIGNQNVPFAKWAGPGGMPRGEESASWLGVGIGESEMASVVKRVKDEFAGSIKSSALMDTTDDGQRLWPIAPYHSTPVAVATYIDVDIEKNKILVPAEDGKGMYVYLKTEVAGIPIQLRTKDKRPLYISFDTSSKRHNLPVYENPDVAGRKVERSPFLEFRPLGLDIKEPEKIDRMKRPSGYLPE